MYREYASYAAGYDLTDGVPGYEDTLIGEYIAAAAADFCLQNHIAEQLAGGLGITLTEEDEAVLAERLASDIETNLGEGRDGGGVLRLPRDRLRQPRALRLREPHRRALRARVHGALRLLGREGLRRGRPRLRGGVRLHNGEAHPPAHNRRQRRGPLRGRAGRASSARRTISSPSSGPCPRRTARRSSPSS